MHQKISVFTNRVLSLQTGHILLIHSILSLSHRYVSILFHPYLPVEFQDINIIPETRLPPMSLMFQELTSPRQLPYPSPRVPVKYAAVLYNLPNVLLRSFLSTFSRNCRIISHILPLYSHLPRISTKLKFFFRESIDTPNRLS